MYGQLGHGNTEKQSSPKMVDALAEHTIYLLACGNFHTVRPYHISIDKIINYLGLYKYSGLFGQVVCCQRYVFCY